MSTKDFEVEYVSTNCNQTPEAADWGKNNLICYAASDTVIVFNPNDGSGGRVTDTLIHTKRVNSVKWVSKFNSADEIETELVSGVADGHVYLWTYSDKEKCYRETSFDYKSNTNIVDAIYRDNNKENVYIVSAHMDSCVRIHHREKLEGNLALLHTLNFGYHVCTAMRLAVIPNTRELILALALDNSKINIYKEHNNEFVLQCVITGHDDWVRGLDFTVNKNDLVLASSSQDAFIRLWRITPHSPKEAEYIPLKIQTKDSLYRINLECVLTGHEGWIYSVRWSPNGLQLLSASIDKTMILWEFDPATNLWLDKVRLGEVGGNTLGFYGGFFSPDGATILAYSYHGAFHMWRLNGDTSWEPMVTVGGHFDEVVDLSWDPKGEFIVTASSDQTTRIHAPWSKDGKKVTWHEIARPQVHGHNLFCLSMLSRYKFASGAEEKVVRIFEAPRNFIENFRRICKITDDKEGDDLLNSGLLEAKGASVPSLGLSNKAVFTDDNTEEATPDSKNPYESESHFTATELHNPPTEETLLENTLWPEVQKLYGHGYEVYSLASSPDGQLLASSCKSTSQEHAAIIIWNSSNWKMVQKLISHNLTVVQMEFSPDSKYLLSVSRDRRWSLFDRTQNGEFELISTTDKKLGVHARIIWACSWSHDSQYFATGSRDNKVVVWTINKNKEKVNCLGQCQAVHVIKPMKDGSVTALAFAPTFVEGEYLLAVGLERGCIILYRLKENCQKALDILYHFGHSLTVKKLKFRPVCGKTGEKGNDKNVLQLASCSSNNQVKVFNIFLDKLKNVELANEEYERIVNK
ncbi:unnamed protein product [Brassicogethes aeneus]|uniref:Elongator complex protein 2 n=1 Tax=Brassicogethes aeneus TaxID=1431903 RepID=A0A9P0B651_BRAAE|nr:unnamed protein product [Brassicogethes aeneus]